MRTWPAKVMPLPCCCCCFRCFCFRFRRSIGVPPRPSGRAPDAARRGRRRSFVKTTTCRGASPPPRLVLDRLTPRVAVSRTRPKLGLACHGSGACNAIIEWRHDACTTSKTIGFASRRGHCECMASERMGALESLHRAAAAEREHTSSRVPAQVAHHNAPSSSSSRLVALSNLFPLSVLLCLLIDFVVVGVSSSSSDASDVRLQRRHAAELVEDSATNASHLTRVCNNNNHDEPDNNNSAQSRRQPRLRTRSASRRRRHHQLLRWALL
jgi:hypothetical protein